MTAGGVSVRGVSVIDLDSGIVRMGDLHCPAGTAGPVTTVDGAGLFALPGLIDMHVHVTGLDDSTDLVGSALRNLRLALRAGITTVRDLGMPEPVAVAVLAAVAADPAGYPRIEVAGPALTAPGGHGDTPGRPNPLAAPVSTAEAGVALVHRLAAAGASAIKLITGSGSAPAGHPELSIELMHALVGAAHSAGLPVAAHANFRLEHVERALDAACDTLEHGTVLCDVDAHRLRRFAERGGAYTPTLSVLQALRTSSRTDPVGQRLREAATATWPKALESVLVARRHGIAVLAGTDSGAAGVAFGTLRQEIRLLADAGLSPLDALHAATITAERHLHRPASAARCDALLLRANPLDDLGALDRPAATIRAGTLAHLADGSRLDRPGR